MFFFCAGGCVVGCLVVGLSSVPMECVTFFLFLLAIINFSIPFISAKFALSK